MIKLTPRTENSKAMIVLSPLIALILTALSALIIFFFVTIFAPFIAPHDPFDLASIDLMDASLPPAWFAEGETRFLLGTDDQGRDILSTIIYGSRISLFVGFVSVLLARLILSFFIAVIIFLYSDKISNAFFEGNSEIVKITSLFVLITTLEPIYKRFLRIIRHVKTLSALKIIEGYGALLIYVLVFYLGGGLFQIILAALFFKVLILIFLIFLSASNGAAETFLSLKKNKILLQYVKHFFYFNKNNGENFCREKNLQIFSVKMI